MIGKLIKGTGARGVLEYMFSPIDGSGRMRPRATLIGGTFAGATPREIASEFAAFRNLRPSLSTALVHEMLRLSDLEAEPDDATWNAIAAFWAVQMGFDAWCAVSHGDNHIHIFASRIKVDGSVISDSNDYRTSERIVRRIERKFGLRFQKASHLLANDPPIVEDEQPSITGLLPVLETGFQLVSVPEDIGQGGTTSTQGQLRVKEKIGTAALPSELVAAIVTQAMALKISVTEMIDAMQCAGVDVRPNLSKTGTVSGLSYRVGSVVVTAKAMGRAFTWSRMLAGGLSYDPVRDLPALEAARLQSFDREKELPNDPTVPLAVPASELVTRASLNSLIAAAGTSSFKVQVYDNGPSPWDLELSPILETAHEIAHQYSMGHEISIASTDRRLVTLGDVTPSGLEALSAKGFEPFAVLSTGTNKYSVAIRLVHWSEAEPSPKVAWVAARTIARDVGASQCDLPVPGLAQWGAHRLRRVCNIVRRDILKVASKGYALLQSIVEQMAQISQLGKLSSTVEAPKGGAGTNARAKNIHSNDKTEGSTPLAIADKPTAITKTSNEARIHTDKSTAVSLPDAHNQSSANQEVDQFESQTTPLDEFNPW